MELTSWTFDRASQTSVCLSITWGSCENAVSNSAGPGWARDASSNKSPGDAHAVGAGPHTEKGGRGMHCLSFESSLLSYLESLAAPDLPPLGIVLSANRMPLGGYAPSRHTAGPRQVPLPDLALP